MPSPPVFWEREQEECAEARAEAERLRQALRINSVGIGPIVDLVAQLTEELRAHAPADCPRCAALFDEADQLVANGSEE